MSQPSSPTVTRAGSWRSDSQRTQSEAKGGDSPLAVPPAGAIPGDSLELSNPALKSMNMKLGKALTDAEDRIARLVVDHAREMAVLRAEMERTAQDRQQLELMVEEARNDQLAAETSLTLNECEVAQVERLRSRLAQEAEATQRIRDELERAQARAAAAEAREAAEQARLEEVRRTAAAARRDAETLKALREKDVADFDEQIRQAEEARRQAEADAERLRAELHKARSDASGPMSPPPSVPALNLAARLSMQTNASPDFLSAESARAGHSFSARFQSESPGRGNRNVSAFAEANKGTDDQLRAWAARRRAASFDDTHTPRASEVYPARAATRRRRTHRS
jgi:hypothetical protein